MTEKAKKKFDLEHYKKHFKTKLHKNGDCLYFMGSRNPKGYGQFSSPYETAAHRFAWFSEYGAIPKGLMVLHNCDSPPCCEISHLRLGTAKENTQDMIDRNRPRGPKNSPIGENNAASKITDQQAQEIAKLISQGRTGPEISKHLNVSLWIVNDIRCRKNRKYLEFTVPKKKEYKKNCLICTTEFKTKPYEFEKSKYCSHKCYSRSLEKQRDIITCEGCGKEVTVLSRKDSTRKYCTIECLWKSMKGKYPENIKNNI